MGVPDYCDGGFSASMSLPPTAGGFWCGGPGTPYGHGTAGHLYYFDDGYVTDLGKCANGCVLVSGTAPDYCK
jgi:hypothetical protein